MNLIRISTIAVVGICSVSVLFAQDGLQARASANSGATKASAKDTTSAAPAGNSEVFQNILIDAGQSIPIDSTLDYSSAATVAVTIYCTVCSTGATSLGNSGLVLQATWLVANAATYVATETKSATTFPYWDAGGGLFTVYGSQFRLNLQNKGSQPIAVQQLTIFRRNQ